MFWIQNYNILCSSNCFLVLIDQVYPISSCNYTYIGTAHYKNLTLDSDGYISLIFYYFINHNILSTYVTSNIFFFIMSSKFFYTRAWHGCCSSFIEKIEEKISLFFLGVKGRNATFKIWKTTYFCNFISFKRCWSYLIKARKSYSGIKCQWFCFVFNFFSKSKSTNLSVITHIEN